MSQDSSLPFNPYPSPPACISQTVTMLLRSPFHALMSHQTMILTLRGRKTGQSYTFPVTYLQESNTVFCLTRFNWWKNLRGGAEVMLRLRGKSVTGIAEPLLRSGSGKIKLWQEAAIRTNAAWYSGTKRNAA
jgi:hypothetical protein